MQLPDYYYIEQGSNVFLLGEPSGKQIRVNGKNITSSCDCEYADCNHSKQANFLLRSTDKEFELTEEERERLVNFLVGTTFSINQGIAYIFGISGKDISIPAHVCDIVEEQLEAETCLFKCRYCREWSDFEDDNGWDELCKYCIEEHDNDW